jgi:hypothetical protein
MRKSSKASACKEEPIRRRANTSRWGWETRHRDTEDGETHIDSRTHDSQGGHAIGGEVNAAALCVNLGSTDERHTQTQRLVEPLGSGT